MNRKELRHDRHTVSLLSDHMVFAPKYMGKILTDDVAMVMEGIICKTCKELGIEIIEIAVNPTMCIFSSNTLRSIHSVSLLRG